MMYWSVLQLKCAAKNVMNNECGCGGCMVHGWFIQHARLVSSCLGELYCEWAIGGPHALTEADDMSHIHEPGRSTLTQGSCGPEGPLR